MIERHSEFSTTRTFALNTFYGDFVVGEFFSTPTINLVPSLIEFHLDIADPSGFATEPSGFRHLQTHPAFKQVISSGINNTGASFGPFDFSITNVSSGIGISCTRCFVFRADQFDCPTSRINNMKIWAPDLSDFLIPEAFEIVFDTRQTGNFPSGIQLAVGTIFDKSFHLPRSLPDFSNLNRQDGGTTIHGSGDLDVSEYVMMAVAASGTLPLGEYISNPSGFQIRTTFNIDNLFNFFD